MPVNLEWHPSLPILLATYSGVLSTDEYYMMSEQRQTMLNNGPDQIILVADMRQMESFPDSLEIDLCENVLTHEKIHRVLIVSMNGLYSILRNAVAATEGRDLRVLFFHDLEEVLNTAEKLAQQLV
ncbi:MAG: hypothetical protein JXJ20_07865 [Anaerolineae bacterium]|jgi:hypothetical protein|nr:hypothetical protein [Anaerolineae bacterium]